MSARGALDDGDDGSDDGVDTTLDQLSDEEAAALCADSTEALSPEVFVELSFVCWVDPAVVTALPECASDITAGDLQACMVAPEEGAGLQDLCPDLFGTPA